MSHATMERMVLDAVRGKPTTTPSRTEHFRRKARASTPFREAGSDSSDAEIGTITSADSDDQEVTDHGESGDSSSFRESDSACDMALITASFRSVRKGGPSKSDPTIAGAEDIETGSQETDRSSQDVALSEVKTQTLSGQSRSQAHDSPNAGSLCARSSSAKLVGRDPFFWSR